MFLIVNLNPAVDKIYTLNNFTINKIHRTNDVFTQAGGKGINVARTCNILNGNYCLTGLLGGYSSKLILDNLDYSNIHHNFCFTDKQSRTCLIIIDPDNDTQTVINEDGPLFSDDDLNAFIDKFTKIICHHDFLVISGSLPVTISRNIYCELINIAKKHNVKSIVDTSKVALIKAIEQKPFMIKPNIFEIAEISEDNTIIESFEKDNFKPLISICEKIISSGVNNIAVTLGEKGVIFLNKCKKFIVKPPEIKCVNAIASGDAMTAAVAIELDNNKTFEEAFISGVASGTANATVGGLRFTYENYLDIRKKVTLEYI